MMLSKRSVTSFVVSPSGSVIHSSGMDFFLSWCSHHVKAYNTAFLDLRGL